MSVPSKKETSGQKSDRFSRKPTTCPGYRSTAKGAMAKNLPTRLRFGAAVRVLPGDFAQEVPQETPFGLRERLECLLDRLRNLGQRRVESPPAARRDRHMDLSTVARITTAQHIPSFFELVQQARHTGRMLRDRERQLGLGAFAPTDQVREQLPGQHRLAHLLETPCRRTPYQSACTGYERPQLFEQTSRMGETFGQHGLRLDGTNNISQSQWLRQQRNGRIPAAMGAPELLRALAPVAPIVLFSASLFSCGKGDAGAAAKTRPPPLIVVQKVEAHDVRVRKGQLVALVRPSDLPDQLAAARGTLAQVQSSAALARTNFERAQKLAPTGVVSQQELQQSSAALASAEASESAAKAQIGALAVRIGETRIESPIDGVISQRRLDPGALVGPPGGGAIVTVVRIDRLRVFITINERDAPGVVAGKEAHVELDALPAKSFSGTVVRVAPSFDPVTRTLDAEIQLPNDAGELRPGMYGRAAIRLEMHPQVPVVPVNALQMSENQKYVFVLNGSKVARRPIQVGPDVDDGQFFEVTHGLAPGEEVVTAGADGLSEGATVRVTRDVDPYTGGKTSPRASSSAAGAGGGAVRD